MMLFKFVKRWLRKAERKTLIYLGVILFHVVILSCATLSSHKKQSPKHPQHLAVRTIAPLAPPSTTQVTLTSTSSPKQKIKKLPLPSPVKPKTIPPSPKKPQQSPPKLVKKGVATPSQKPKEQKIITSPPQPQKEPAPLVSEDLVQKLEESIAKIEEKRDNLKAKQVVSRDPTFQIASMLSLQSDPADSLLISSLRESLGESLAKHLHTVLRLPDFGEVKVQLHFCEDGSIASVNIIQAASKKNRDYLEEQLPNLFFSQIQGLELSEKERSFVITFCNEI